MTTNTAYDYLEGPYLEGPYLLGYGQGADGFQATIIINSSKNNGFQTSATINSSKSIGAQSAITILDKQSPYAFQSAIQILDKLNAKGAQSQIQILNYLNSLGSQAEITINSEEVLAFQAALTINAQTAKGTQVLTQIAAATKATAYQAKIVITDYLSPKALQASIVIANADKELGMQALMQIVDFTKSSGMQTSAQIVDFLDANGFEVRVDKYPTSVCSGVDGYLENDYLLDPYLTEIWCTRPGVQAAIYIQDYLKPNGAQAEITIVDKLKPFGFQCKINIIDYKAPTGFQADVARNFPTAFQTLATIYNTTNLRILCEFPSRGLNASNWTANSTMAGDFSVQNLDTDVVEQVWRSNNVLTGVRLTTDTGLPQGVFLDTLAILNHNLTKSATVTLLGSNDPTFAIIGVTIPLEARLTNMFYIAPTLPTAGYRYWRFDIDDATNSDGYLEIGTILFGAADIFQGECFVDEIEFELKDFADTVRTEGFTNVANSRTQKRRLRLDFRSLSFQKRNFTIMRDMFERDRTVHKCLWIPTPHESFQEVTARFAVFGKLSTIPTERHNNKGPDQDWVSFTADVDESL